MKKTTWQKILDGESQTSTEISHEIQALTNSSKELSAGLPGLKETLEKERRGLLSEATGAYERVQETERAISKAESKISAVSDVLKDLDVALKKALSVETEIRQTAIAQEITGINNEVSELRKEALTYFSKAAAIFNKIMGHEQADHNLGYGFFQRCNLSTELSRQIDAEISDQRGPSLYARREHLERERGQLSKKST